MRKTTYFIAALILLGAGFFFAGRSSLFSASSHALLISPRIAEFGPSVRIGGAYIPVEVVRDATAIAKGLSGRASLERERGMLFIFPRADRYRFWMPDMHFPIDIIWIEGGKVAALTENVSPEFDPAHPRFYTPPKPVQYVLEVNAGFTRAKGIQAGDPAAFSHIE
ncbi:MAG: DUF192 domain-containing protein [Patescibacteria group bacterium]